MEELINLYEPTNDVIAEDYTWRKELNDSLKTSLNRFLRKDLPRLKEISAH